MATPGATAAGPSRHEQIAFAFHEYEMVAEDTAKLSDRRQTVNTLFVSINTIFLTGVGYLIYTFFQTSAGSSHVIYYALGFLAIAIVTTNFNRSWLRLSEQSRRLIDLRIRYLVRLEAYLRDSGYFPTVDTRLKGIDPNKDAEYEDAPPSMPNSVIQHADGGGTPRRWMVTRGTYSLEEVLYNNPNPKFKVFGFSRAEQIVGRTFTWAYWAAFILSLAAILLELARFYLHFHPTVGPFQF